MGLILLWRDQGDNPIVLFTAGMIKSVEYIVQPLGKFIIASVGEMILFSVSPGHQHSLGLLFITPKQVLIWVELYYKIWSYIIHWNWEEGFNLNIILEV